MEKISDYGTYTDGMRKSMADKTWFLNMIDGAKEIVDYGCADGALLEYIRDAMAGVFDLTGIDIDEKMLHLAADRLNDGSHTPVLLTQPEPFKDICGETVHGACLNCGSVIHEVYSYGTPESIEKFWDFAFGTGFKYIAIRDMAMSKTDILVSKEKQSDALRKIGLFNYVYPDAARRYEDYMRRAANLNKSHPYSYNWRDVIHYLLKYRYVANWNREMRENYLPLTIEEILLKISDNYRVKYYEHYTLPYLKDQVMNDFSIDLTTKTHYKLLLERID